MYSGMRDRHPIAIYAFPEMPGAHFSPPAVCSAISGLVCFYPSSHTSTTAPALYNMTVPETMRAVILKESYKVAVEDVPTPKIKEDGDVLVKVHLAGLCG